MFQNPKNHDCKKNKIKKIQIKFFLSLMNRKETSRMKFIIKK